MARLLLLPLHCQQQLTIIITIITHIPIIKYVFRRFGNVQFFFFLIIFFFLLLLFFSYYLRTYIIIIILKTEGTKREVTQRNSHDSVVMDHLKRVYII